MRLDRKIQLEVLNAAANVHPASMDINVFQQLFDTHGEETMASNLHYLQGHGLIEGGVSVGAGVTPFPRTYCCFFEKR
jgi:hypothetical protein